MSSMMKVAREANVAVSTVSLTLNHRDRVKPETRERVEQAMQKLGYRPREKKDAVPPKSQAMRVAFRDFGLGAIRRRFLHPRNRFRVRALFASRAAHARGQRRLLDKFATRTRETFEYDAGFLQCSFDGLRIGGNRCGAVVKQILPRTPGFERGLLGWRSDNGIEKTEMCLEGL